MRGAVFFTHQRRSRCPVWLGGAPRGGRERRERGSLFPCAGSRRSYFFFAVFLAAFFAGFFATFLALFFTVFFTATVSPLSL
jgi:hypothetical protein